MPACRCIAMHNESSRYFSTSTSCFFFTTEAQRAQRKGGRRKIKVIKSNHFPYSAFRFPPSLCALCASVVKKENSRKSFLERNNSAKFRTGEHIYGKLSR